MIKLVVAVVLITAYMKYAETLLRSPSALVGRGHPAVVISMVNTNTGDRDMKKGKTAVREKDVEDDYDDVRREHSRLNFDRTDPVTRVKIGGDRVILPGDYIVHEKYGIGRYVGVRNIDLTPARGKPTYQPVVIIQYRDSEVSFFKRTVRNELWIYRNSESGFQELSTVLDTRKWRRRRSAAEKDAKKTGINLVRMMAIRNGYSRTPCIDTSRLPSYEEFERNFKFTPTEDQIACFDAIARDMTNNTRPMDRLVCGDVGFGKTEVAMRAMYRAVLSNRQVALLAPTRVLALQHLRVISNRMPNVNVQLLRGGGQGKDVKAALADGRCQIVVGTHALLQNSVKFDNLGLLIVDEEQRFGVDQKEKLKAAASGVDVLTLSATPIPRTLQMSLTGLRDFSLVMTPPKGRKEVQVQVGHKDNGTIVKAIEAEVERDGQAFVVVPFVANVSTTAAQIKTLIPDITCVEAHGRHADLEERIDVFSSGRAQVLVATTVVENGIDMPNVNTIIVLDADRFGMSTLYQLRGRVGRSTRQAYAFFMTRRDKVLTRESEARLMYLETFTAMGSGYDLSKRDMEMRGAGQVFGASQSGSKDVGRDFQAKILELAIEEIKLDVAMPCVATWVCLRNRFEREWGAELIEKEMPSVEDLSGVSRWEAEVAEKLIAITLETHSRTRAVDANTDTGALVQEMLRKFLAANSHSDLRTLLKQWRTEVFASAASATSGNGSGGAGLATPDTLSRSSKEIDASTSGSDETVPVVLQELIKRALLRILCRRVGVFSVERRGTDILLRSEGINKKIWSEKLSDSVPRDLRDFVSFMAPADEVPNSREREAEAEYAPRQDDRGGNIVLRDCFEDHGGLAAEDMLTMPVALLRLVSPLANAADMKLLEEVEANSRKGFVQKEEKANGRRR